MDEYDIVLIGGGIVGVSAAWMLKRYYPDATILLIEKESSLSKHQTGHNSGVIHSGVYYNPGSLKADLCKRGAAQTLAFCREHGLPYEQCGKLLVATNKVEYERMEALEKRCIQNGIEIQRLSEAELKKEEPNIKGIAALLIPGTGITDYKKITHLIYPIPDPALPFLGVHLTRMIDGSVTVGPNAVLGWKREGYGSFNLDLKDCLEMIKFPGFWKVVTNNVKSGLSEIIDSFYKPGYLNRVRKYCPILTISDLYHYPSGIRAQAVKKDGSLVHDFLFAESERSLHVCNAPSPAATSAMPIGEYLCRKVAEKFYLR